MNKNIKYLIENIVLFDVANYEDDENTVIDNDTIYNITTLKPRTKEELLSIIEKRIKDNDLTILNLNDIDTSLITDMLNLFQVKNKKNIYKIIFDGWDTSNVTNMENMFIGLENLVELDLSNFNTSLVTDMSCMFYECKSLKKVDLSNFDTSNVMYMYNMFYKCHLLETLDLTSFTTNNLEDTESMFEGCYVLKTIKLSDKWKINDDIITNCMFTGCELLSDIDFSGFTIKLDNELTDMFNGCDSKLKQQYLKLCMS